MKWYFYAFLGGTLGIIAATTHERAQQLFCCQAAPYDKAYDMRPQHQDPPDDSLGDGQQKGRGIYGHYGGTLARDDSAAKCMAEGAVPHWQYYEDGRYSMSCVIGNSEGTN